MKKCKKCGISKPLVDFQKAARYKGGLFSWCRSCSAEYTKSWRASHPGAQQGYHRLHRYGMSQIEYDALLDAQGGKCRLCASESRLNVDHSHTTGRIRGLLCVRCNTALGAFGDDPERLRAAARYVDQ